MSNYITLLGAEDVGRAGSTIASAAGTIRQAANSMEDSLYRQRLFMDEWLFRLEEVLKNGLESTSKRLQT